MEWKIREGYVKDPKAQRLLGELRQGKKLKDIKLANGLLKYKQNRVYIPQDKLRLLVLNKEHDSLIGGHKGEKATMATVSKRYCCPGMKDEIIHFVKIVSSANAIELHTGSKPAYYNRSQFHKVHSIHGLHYMSSGVTRL